MSSRRSARSRSNYSEDFEAPDTHEVPDDDEAGYDEDSEVTRCVCGHDELQPPHQREDPSFNDEMSGLFIQCELCSVWQHGYCVGLKSEAAVPEKYWCETCRPDMHTLVFRGDRNSSLYDATRERRDKRKPKRREEEKEAHQKQKDLKRAERTRAMDKEYEQDLKKALEESARLAAPKRPVEDEKPVPTAKLLSSHKRPRRSPDEVKDEVKEEVKEEVKAEMQPPLAPSSAASNVAAPVETTHTNDTSLTTPDDTANSDESAKARKRSRAKSVPKVAPKAAPLGDADKPSKPRLPPPKTSLTEMRKRVSAILEFIGRTQVELASETNDKASLAKLVEESEADGDQGKEEVRRTVEKFEDNYRETFGVMDRLTRKLLLWEQQFGKYSDKVY
ncbi:hypothetical protein BABINDRAFT_90579 [Babjeviella inositovora NRRL Y-12698]|uniref:Zinc finger PHD-type domain-containing protein n=1 Tax=Babjeviella inositovora NRRL Y-12698 TaxID=984486 RepID=A0A1E3QJU5_9ASCO|nr:uncharacterized protein BABINDRAFT_90579 [Babjeviella inositovora NRRL Y-12698]ODQ77953.1 hypothetical protein BABINDRAFT_90579 [Babjeviella inositovora NRRL Y-12698]